MATIDGADPIEVCALPTVPLFVDGEVLENPKQVKADLKDDLSAYNAKMLENMSDFFQTQVESKSAAKKMISPDGESCTYWPQTLLTTPRTTPRRRTTLSGFCTRFATRLCTPTRTDG